MIIGEGIKTLAAGASVEIEPEFSATREKAGQFLVTNDSAIADGYKIYVCGPNGKPALGVPAQQAVVIEDRDKFKILAASDNGGAASYIVGQIFGGKIDVG